MTAASSSGNPALAAQLTAANESAWLRMGAVSEVMNDIDKALYSYENVLRHNPYNVKALSQIANFSRARDQFPKAVEYYQRILAIENNNGEIWGAIGHCYLMMDDLQKAYTAYQQALYHLPNPKDPNLWYGIGILYDRYGSFEHAEEAFTAVLKMDQKFEKANEIYFRLGIIYKQQQKYEQSLECFRYILHNPPRPLVQGDIWFQIGHVCELKKEFPAAKEAYERVLQENPNHAKVLQQLGWLYHHNTSFGDKDQELAISYLMRSIEADSSDGQTWYLLGRCYMAQQKYRKAYDAYQQAVYRDGRNPTFWCSIGVLYYQINQYRDALDAYSRAIRLNPYLSEVWYDLGTLYESCNQIHDSLDAYQRAAELDPNNKHIQQRLSMLRGQLNGDVAHKQKQTKPTDLPNIANSQSLESPAIPSIHSQNSESKQIPSIHGSEAGKEKNNAEPERGVRRVQHVDSSVKSVEQTPEKKGRSNEEDQLEEGSDEVKGNAKVDSGSKSGKAKKQQAAQKPNTADLLADALGKSRPTAKEYVGKARKENEAEPPRKRGKKGDKRGKSEKDSVDS